MRLLNFTIIKLTVAILVGILLGYYVSIPLPLSYVMVGITLLIAYLSYRRAQQRFKQEIWFGLTSVISMICIGVLTVNLHNPKQSTTHYSHRFKKPEIPSALNTISFRVDEVLRSNSYYETYYVTINTIGAHKTTGKVLLKLKKTSTSMSPSLHVDATYIARTAFQSIRPVLNPGAFDYKTYLERQYVYHQLILDKSALFSVSNNITSIYGLAYQLRQYLISKLQTFSFSKDSLAIISALCLGERQNISKTLQNTYTDAGVIHILALSGLHIGILLLFLNRLLRPLERIKHGRRLKISLILLILWGFGMVTGLSASVVRSITMFSILAIAMQLKRPTNTYNTLAISIFILLLCKPLLVFDVGFQLSYCAVIAIISITPLLARLWHPRHWLVQLYWRIFTVSCAAQIGILPISLYYFHQFSGLFLLSNLVILPCLGGIIGAGFIIIVLGSIDMLPHSLVTLFDTVILAMNAFVHWVAQQDIFLFKAISFQLSALFISYVLIVSCYKFWTTALYKYFKFILYGCIAMSFAFCVTAYTRSKHKFIVFHKPKHSILAHIAHSTVFYSDLKPDTLKAQATVTNFKVKAHLKTYKQDTLHSIYSLGEKQLLIVDHLGLYNVQSFKPDYILLRESPKLNLERLISHHRPLYIIADGSNYTSFIKRWKLVCSKRDIPFHYTGTDGAFEINYQN